jgi:hypothetical protein
VLAGGALPGPGVLELLVVVVLVVESEGSDGGVVTGASAVGGVLEIVVAGVDAAVLVGWVGESIVGSLCVWVRPGGVAVAPVVAAPVAAVVVVVVVVVVVGFVAAFAAPALTAVEAISVPLWIPFG